MNWEPKTDWKPMYRQNKVETENGTEELMVLVGKYETANGIKSYNTNVEYQATNNEELYYLDEGNYISVE
jgi:hypothetical protein